jgi:CheY-like chemotaxis protein
MTAQNMGKKILTEAGYEVVAVSNGAAAVKKIAEQKPDIIILDVYMPGYSGLEVCEKVRANLETAKTPVLLTVGKMEPYKPEDANRVKADGVIIKPFEASDLLAIIKKFEERIGQASVPPMVEQTVLLERQYQQDAITEAQMQNHATGKTGIQPMVEVPDHMAGSSAFPDMLSAESTQHFAVNTPAAAFETSVIVPAPPVPSAEYDLPVSWKEEERPEPVAAATSVEHTQEIVATPVEAEQEVPAEQQPEAEAYAVSTEESFVEPPHPHFIPVFTDPVPEPAAYEIIPTAALPTDDVEIPREPALQETAEETTRNTVADHVEPGLLTTLSQEIGTSEASDRGPAAAAADSGPAVAASEAAPAPMEAAPAAETTAEVTDADFEARVAAAMAAYSHVAEPVAAPEAEAHVAVAQEAAPATEGYAAHAVAVPETVAEPAPSFEYHPPVGAPNPISSVAQIVSAPVEVAHESVTATPASEPAQPEPAVIHGAVTAGVEAAAAAAAAETGSDHHTITQAVHRVMERLKPELVEEIMRELRSSRK